VVDHLNIHLAEILGISPPAIDKWRKAGFPPLGDAGEFPVDDVIRWLRDKWVEQRESKLPDDVSKRMEAAEVRKKEADAILAEMKIAEACGRLCDRDQLVRGFREHITTCAKMLQDMDKKMARYVPEKYRAEFIGNASKDLCELMTTLSNSRKEENAE